MFQIPLRFRYSLALLLLFVAVSANAQPPQRKTTGVLVMLTVKPEIQRDLIMKVMPDEIRATTRLYLDGKIQQWYSRSDSRGVVFILACKDVDEARSIMESLPLSQQKFVNLEFTAIGPLMPLQILLNDQGASK